MSLRTVDKTLWLTVLGVFGVVGLIVVIVMWATKDGSKPTSSSGAHFVNASGELKTWEDRERGVICYYAEHGTTGALSCVVLAADGGGR